MNTTMQTKTFADYISVLKRRFPILLVAFIAVFLPGIYVTYSLEATYRSTANFLVEQQSISQDFAQTTVTGYTDERIQGTRQRVMSSANLEGLIIKHGLYPDLAPGSSAAIERFRQSTLFEPQVSEVVNERTGRTMLATISFEVSFDYTDPETTQAVMQDVANLYIEENEGNRLDQVQATIEFLEGNVDRLKDEVDNASSGLADFRQRHSGNLPDQENFNIRIIERNERQIEQLENDIRRARDRKLTLEAELLRLNPMATVTDDQGSPIMGTGSQLAELQRERLRLLSIYSPEHPDVRKINNQIESLTGGSSGGAYVADIQAQLAAAQQALTEARQRYSADHPDVLQKSRSVESLEQQLAAASAQQRPYRMEVPADPAVLNIQQQMRALDSDIADFTAKRNQLSGEIADLEFKLDRLPELDQEYAALNRSHQMATERYTEALNKLDEARAAERLETRGGAERISLISSPRLPAAPYKPNRIAILMLVIVLAAGLGIVLATVADALDETIQSTRDVLAASNIPALAVIPYIETTGDRRQRLRKNFALSSLALATAVATVLIATGAG